MTKQANFSKDLTKKDLIKILEKIDSERTRQCFDEIDPVSDRRDIRQHAGKSIKL